MSSEKVDKVVSGLERLANADGYRLDIHIHRTNPDANYWVITFRAGEAVVSARLLSFTAAPKIVLDPFLEEMLKQVRESGV